MSRFALVLLAAGAAGCLVEGERAPLTGSEGVTVDPGTGVVALDRDKVPVLPSCAPGQVVRRGANGWECGAVGVEAGPGLVEEGSTLSVDFGTGPREAAPGNHDHDGRYRPADELLGWNALDADTVPDFLLRAERYTDAAARLAVRWSDLAPTVGADQSWPGTVPYERVVGAPTPYSDDRARAAVSWLSVAPSVGTAAVWPGRVLASSIDGLAASTWAVVAPSVTATTAWPGTIDFARVRSVTWSGIAPAIPATTMWPGRVDWWAIDNRPSDLGTWAGVATTVPNGAIENALLAHATVTVAPEPPLTGGGEAALGGGVNIGLGTVPVTKGGTGLTTGPSAANQFLRSNGSGGWSSGAITAADMPSLADSYVALTGAQSVAGIKTFTNDVVFSTTGARLRDDQGGSLELGAGNMATNTGNRSPFIDFHYGNGTAQDYNVRLQNNFERQLELDADYFRLGNAGVAGSSGIGAALIFSGNPGGDDNDPIWMARYNYQANQGELRLVLGDDPSTAGGLDYFTIGTSSVSWIDRTSGFNRRFSVNGQGTVRAAGTFISNTSPDIAETIQSASDVEAGDVVCADHDRPEFAVRCDARNASVIGVVSDGSSGFIINAHAAVLDDPLTGKPLVLAGRVPVKVSLANGPIAIGDWLAPSDEPGVAVRAVEPGPVVGMALEAFAGDTGPTGWAVTFIRIGERVAAEDVTSLRAENAELRIRTRSLEERVARLEAAIGKLVGD